jgi:hypothetical protein
VRIPAHDADEQFIEDVLKLAERYYAYIFGQFEKTVDDVADAFDAEPLAATGTDDDISF